MSTLKDILSTARKEKRAVGHFNISDIAGLHAIHAAAAELSLPVIIGVSEGERGFIGTRRTADLVRSIREEYGYPIFLNSDHTHTLDGVREVARAGFDAVVYDPVAAARKKGEAFTFEDHVRATKQAVEEARSLNPGMLIEGELGYIGSSSALLDAIPEGAEITEDALTKPEEAAAFVRETGIDLLAPSVGNLHGMFKNAPNPRLNIDRVAAIYESASVPLVLHGGSGIVDEDFVSAIEAGITIVHINTEIRRAWREGVEAVLGERPNEVTPYVFLKEAEERIKAVVKGRLALFDRI